MTQTQVALASEPWLYEPPLIEIPWKPSQAIEQPLKIGVMWHDEVVIPHPSIRRCLQETVSALRKGGHTIIDWKPTLHRDLVDCINKLYFMDGGQEYYDVMCDGNEPASPLMKWRLDTAATKTYTAAESWKVRSSHIPTQSHNPANII